MQALSHNGNGVHEVALPSKSVSDSAIGRENYLELTCLLPAWVRRVKARRTHLLACMPRRRSDGRPFIRYRFTNRIPLEFNL